VCQITSLAVEKRLLFRYGRPQGEHSRKPGAVVGGRSRVDPESRAMTKKLVRGFAAICLLAVGLLPAGVEAAAAAGLEAAREELRLSTETERRMREEFESLLATGSMSAAEVGDFEDYLLRLGTMVDAQRRRVAHLEGSDSGMVSGAGSDSPQPTPLSGDFKRGLTDEEKIALLDAELGSSMSEFDEKLLREQRELAEKSRAVSTGEAVAGGERGSGSSGEAGEGEGQQAGGEGRQSGGAADGKSANGGTESGQQSGAEEQGEAGGQEAEGDDRMASAGGASEGGRHTGHTSTPPDIPDGKDDDIVARQLREAAESEQDPELREKLWEEYRKYKKRTP